MSAGAPGGRVAAADPRAPPRYATRLVGRDAALAAVLASLAAQPVTVITGSGGVGKTRLAAEAAHRWGGRALFVDLSAAHTADDMALALLRDAGTLSPRPPDRSLVAHAREAVAACGVDLVVLDNLEQLGDLAAAVVSAWVSPGAPILATSRAPLGPGTSALRLEPLGPEDAAQLFVRAVGGAVDAEPGRAPDLVAALVREVGGLPLALELAAGRAAVWPLEALVDAAARDPLRVLRDPARPEGRGTALERSVAWSVELVPPEARTALEVACGFLDPFDRDAHAAALGEDAGDVLALLVDRHLLRAEPEGRFAAYPEVRHVVDAAVAPEDRAPRALRAARWFAALATAFRRGERPWTDVARSLADVRAVIERGRRPDAPPALREAAQVAAEGLYPWLAAVTTPDGYLALLDDLTARGPTTEVSLRLVAARGRIADHHRRLDAMRASYEALVDGARALGIPPAEVTGGFGLARLAWLEGRLDDHAALAARTVALARGVSDPSVPAGTLAFLTNHLLIAGAFDALGAQLAEAREAALRAGPVALGNVLRRRALAEVSRGAFAAARATLAEEESTRTPGAPTPQFRSDEVAIVRAWLAAADPPGPDAVAATLATLSPLASAATRGLLTVLAAVESALAGGPGAYDDDAAAWVASNAVPRERAAEVALLGLVGVVRGGPPPPPPPAPDPALRHLHALIAACAETARGTRDPDAPPPPGVPSAPGQVALRALRSAQEQASRRRRAWWIAPDGTAFAPPGGPRVPLGHRPILARVAAALADATTAGGGASVEALFAAGWPGARAPAGVAGNRVRVAVTTLRRLGLSIVTWDRARGWSLDAPLRRGPE